MIGFCNDITDLRNVAARVTGAQHAALAALARDGTSLGDLVREAVAAYLAILPELPRLARVVEAGGTIPARHLRLALAAYLDAEEARLGLATPRAGAEATGAQAATQDAQATAPAREEAP